jgi:Flp pilus assembly CpaF family ATPase
MNVRQYISQMDMHKIYELKLKILELEIKLTQALNPVIVISTEGTGSNSNTYLVNVSLFKDTKSANEYIEDTQELHSEHWTTCKIVDADEYNEITSPY